MVSISSMVSSVFLGGNSWHAPPGLARRAGGGSCGVMPEFQPAPGSLPPGHRVYAIGDVHGCDDQLASLHAMVAADLAARPVARRCWSISATM